MKKKEQGEGKRKSSGSFLHQSKWIIAGLYSRSIDRLGAFVHLLISESGEIRGVNNVTRPPQRCTTGYSLCTSSVDHDELYQNGRKIKPREKPHSPRESPCYKRGRRRSKIKEASHSDPPKLELVHRVPRYPPNKIGSLCCPRARSRPRFKVQPLPPEANDNLRINTNKPPGPCGVQRRTSVCILWGTHVVLA